MMRCVPVLAAAGLLLGGLAACVSSTNSPSGWGPAIAQMPQPVAERTRMRVWVGGEGHDLHGLRVTEDSVSGVPHLQRYDCEGCRVGWKLSELDSVQGREFDAYWGPATATFLVPNSPSDTVLYWVDDRPVNLHAVRLEGDVLTGVPFGSRQRCDTCRIGFPRADVDSIQRRMFSWEDAQRARFITLDEAHDILRAEPLAVQGMPVVTVMARWCRLCTTDSVYVVVEQGYDAGLWVVTSQRRDIGAERLPSPGTDIFQTSGYVQGLYASMRASKGWPTSSLSAQEINELFLRLRPMRDSTAAR